MVLEEQYLIIHKLFQNIKEKISEKENNFQIINNEFNQTLKNIQNHIMKNLQNLYLEFGII